MNDRRKAKAGPGPVSPTDWQGRLGCYASGATLVYADQCPYIPGAVQGAIDAFAERGIEAKLVKLESSAEVRARSPTAYGVFDIVCDGTLLTYHYLGKVELRRLDEEFLSPS